MNTLAIIVMIITVIIIALLILDYKGLIPTIKVPKKLIVEKIVIWNFYSPLSMFGSCLWNLCGLLHINLGIKAKTTLFGWAIRGLGKRDRNTLFTGKENFK